MDSSVLKLSVQKSSKRVQKIDGNEKSIKIIDPTTSITSIYYDCLERIFVRLDLESLLNVAQTCKRLQIAGAANFNDRYGKQTIELRSQDYINKDFKGIKMCFNSIYVVDLKLCLPFLRCFGSKISNMRVTYNDSCKPFDCYIDGYINQYCADTLTKITYIGSKHEFSNESFLKPFKNIETLATTFGKGKQISNFVDWFPNLRRLNTHNWLIRKAHPVHFPLLEQICIDLDNCNYGDPGANEFLRINKQLESVEFAIETYTIGVKLSKLLDMISENTSITKLTVYFYFYTIDLINVHGYELLQLANQHPAIIQLDLGDCLLSSENARRFFRLMNSLKWFRFRINGHSEYECLLNKLDVHWEHEYSNDDRDNTQYIVILKKRNEFPTKHSIAAENNPIQRFKTPAEIRI